MKQRTVRPALTVYEQVGQEWALLRSADLAERIWLTPFCAMLPKGSDVLDIGCESGVPIARTLIERGFCVTGLDGARTMVALFAQNLPGIPVHHEDMRRMALGHRFAGLLAWDSFFHLPPDDQPAMFQRFADHAAPGAPLLFSSGTERGDAIGDLAGHPLYHGSLSTAEYERLLSTFGFEVVAHTVHDERAGGRTVWLARFTG